MVLLTEAPQIRHQAHFQASFPRGVDGEDKYALWESNCLCCLLNSIQKMIKIFLFLNRSWFAWRLREQITHSIEGQNITSSKGRLEI